jgi:hypothetical protein
MSQTVSPDTVRQWAAHHTGLRCHRIWAWPPAGHHRWYMCCLLPHSADQPCRYIDNAGDVATVHPRMTEIPMHPTQSNHLDANPGPQVRPAAPAADQDDDGIAVEPPRPRAVAAFLAAAFALAPGAIGLAAWGIAALYFHYT